MHTVQAEVSWQCGPSPLCKCPMMGRCLNMSEWPSLQECYWDMSREEEIQDDPQARLWLLIHLHKKDAEKVRWPDHLLVEDIESETTDESNSWARSMSYSQTDVDAGSQICDGQASHSKPRRYLIFVRGQRSPQLDPQKEHFGAACYRSHLEHAAQELLISLDVVNGHQPSARLVGTLLRSCDHGCQGPLVAFFGSVWTMPASQCTPLSTVPWLWRMAHGPAACVVSTCLKQWTSNFQDFPLKCWMRLWNHMGSLSSPWPCLLIQKACKGTHLFHHCSHKPSYHSLQVGHQSIHLVFFKV